MGRVRVLVVGDLILDEYMHGHVQRISPEAPVPVLDSGESTFALGGAANVAANLVALGCEVQLCGAVGGDAAGQRMITLLGEIGIDTSTIVKDETRATTHKVRVVARGQHVLRIDREETHAFGAGTRETMRRIIDSVLNPAGDGERVQGVLCSDYRKGLLDTATLARVAAAGRRHKIPVIADPKGIEYSRYAQFTCLTPNIHELERATGIELSGAHDTELLRAARQVLDETGGESVVVTCGSQGMVIVEAKRAADDYLHIPTEAREVYDVTGAGDTAIATLAAAIFSGAELGGAARLANAAAGIVVGKLGTATVSRAELEHQLDGNRRGPAMRKITPLEHLAETVRGFQARGLRMVLTNGCFDIVHAGHVAYLQAARALGDGLIVALNTDASIRRLKGDKRPLVEEQDRAAVIAALGCVDHVCLFDEDTPLAVVEALLPDVLVKGADWAPEAVVGRDVVEAHGGRLELIPMLDGLSTSTLVERIVERYSADSG